MTGQAEAAFPLALHDLRGRVAMVTGAGSGLGRQFAVTLAGAGAAVVMVGRRRDALEASADLVAQAGGIAHVEAFDVQDEAAVKAAFGRAAAELGEIDVLINNAGANKPQAAAGMSLEDWDVVVGTNLRGVFLMARTFAGRLIVAGKPGAIVNIASVLGLRVQKGVAAYAASKAGVLQLTRQLALEWSRHGIRVNALVPGYFHTDITDHFLIADEGQALVRRIPARRVGNPSELAGPLLLLAGPGSAYMTGAEIAVDGGLLCSAL